MTAGSLRMLNDSGSTVLIVEDEVLVRIMAADVLAARGLATVEAGTAAEALAELDGRRDIRLMLVDIAMPGGTDGLELARSVAARHSGMPILIMSGRTELHGADLPPNTRFLPKPFSAQGLNWAVDEALGVGCPPAAGRHAGH